MNDKLCKLCEEPLPKVALAFNNRIAIDEGYCCWMCMNSDLGTDKAYRILEDKAKENRISRSKL
jgi:hypothetical protein